MLALIDGDVIVYRVGFASENQTEAQNCINAELVMQDILRAVKADSYRVFLSDTLENNFRYKIDASYKANRKDARRPMHYDSLRLFLCNEYKAEYTHGQEADDALGIAQTFHNENGSHEDYGYGESIICSIDKDLLQIPGQHYNLSTGNLSTISPFDGDKQFYRQLLTGDRVDNIAGIGGIGPVKSERLLAGAESVGELFERVRILYDDDERLLRNGQLLWVRRVVDQLWEFPDGASEDSVSEVQDPVKLGIAT